MGYRVVTVNLDVAETAWLDHLLERLKRKGLTKVTRSELMRLAVGLLQHEVRDRRDAEVIEFFLRALQKDAAMSPVRRLNRRGVVNARVIRRRSSDPHRPRVMRCGSQGSRRSVDRGTSRPGIEPRKQLSPGDRKSTRLNSSH